MSTSTDSFVIRPSLEADLDAIVEIYTLAVLHSKGTFETQAPDVVEMARRRRDILAQDLPWLVAESGGRLMGYAYANQFRPRTAYRYCLEDSIYVHPSARGKGAGRRLLIELINQCESLGARQMLAVIGDSDNSASIGLHLGLGFEHAGLLRNAGWKFGGWLDVVLMQKQLGQGASTVPIDNRNHS